ncbi:MAG: leucine-rich repeat protein, partial [Clostridia bacterium]|nr:leucine-rich repeat protein [Clostridia bacterium]
CSNLSEVTLENGITSITYGMFRDCSSLKSIKIPESVTVISNNSFQNCTSLESIELPEGLKTIYSSAFNGCSSLKLVIIPESVSSLYTDSFPTSTILAVYEDSYAHKFADTNNLLYVIYTGTDFIKVYKVDGVTYYIIDGEAVAVSCAEDVTEVTIPATVEGYPVVELRETFNEHKSIKKVILPEGLKLIGEHAFYFATNLINVNIPSTVTEIGDSAFAGCSRLSGVSLPEGLVKLGSLAFHSCSAITELKLPASLTSIGSYAFAYCSKLTSVEIGSGITAIPSNAFYDCVNLEDLILPANVKSIASGAFVGCAKLKMVTIPETITSMRTDSFTTSVILLVTKDSYAHTYAKNNNLLYFVLHNAENPEIAYGASIEGTVITANGAAAAGATVDIYYADGTLKESVIADANGVYSFTYAEVGEYTVKATLANGTGATAIKVTRMNVFDVFVAGDTAITLKNSYTVSGTVDAYPATVTITDANGNVIATVTTTDGNYTFTNIPNGTYNITATTENGFVTTEVTVFDGNVSDVVLETVEATVTLYGYVEVEDRNGDKHRRNWIEVTLYNAEGQVISNVKSDKDGRYEFDNLPVGDYSVVAEVEEMRPDKEHGYDRNHELRGYAYISVTEAGTYEVDTITLAEDNGNRAEIAGKVTANGEGQVCEIVLRNVHGSEVAKYTTKNNGKYIFVNVSDGLYFITATTASDGMGFTVVIVRGGKVWGETDIRVYKSDKVKNREDKFHNDVPDFDSKDGIEEYRERIAEEKRFYDGLSEKEKKQLSKSYIERLNLYVEWLANCEYNTDEGVKIEQGGLVVSGDELANSDDISFTITVEKQDKWENNGNGVKNEKDHVHHSMKDKAGNRDIVEYYEISMFKTGADGEREITSVYKDTDAMGKFRITLTIPEEYRGHKHYSLVHVHCGEVVTLTDLDDDPNTITVEVDRFSTFALTTTDDELIAEDNSSDVEVSPNFKIKSARLSLSEDINVIYTASIPEGYLNHYMVFTFLGNDYTVYGMDNGDGTYSFAFTHMIPQCLGDNIKATLYATVEGTEVSVCIESYSVRKYCENQFAKSTDEKLLTMLSDLLVYGAKAQLYDGYNVDNLVTEGLELTASVYEALDSSVNKKALTGTADADAKWKSAGLRFENTMVMYAKFAASEAEGLVVNVSINGRTESYNVSELDVSDDGYYYIYFRGILATEFDSEITANFVRNGETVGQTMHYSVNSYVYSQQTSGTNANLKALMEATYNYGASAYAYALSKQ